MAAISESLARLIDHYPVWGPFVLLALTFVLLAGVATIAKAVRKGG